MRRRHLLLLGFALCLTMLLGSCGSTKNFEYFQDIHPGDTLGVFAPHNITFMPGDRISIVVTCKDPKLSAMFNLTTNTMMGGEAGNRQGTTSMSLYTIDSNGDIDFPVIGKIHVGGLSREQTASLIKGILIGREMLPDPVVTVEYGNLYYYMLGETGQGRHTIDRDDLTLIDALTQAGGLSDYGIRDSVLVVRTENGIRKAYNVNMNSWKDVTSSPVYYVKQGDLIYVKPNKTRKRMATANGNTFITPTFWMSMASLLTSIVVLIAN